MLPSLKDTPAVNECGSCARQEIRPISPQCSRQLAQKPESKAVGRTSRRRWLVLPSTDIPYDRLMDVETGERRCRVWEKDAVTTMYMIEPGATPLLPVLELSKNLAGQDVEKEAGN